MSTTLIIWYIDKYMNIQNSRYYCRITGKDQKCTYLRYVIDMLCVVCSNAFCRNAKVSFLEKNIRGFSFALSVLMKAIILCFIFHGKLYKKNESTVQRPQLSVCCAVVRQNPKVCHHERKVTYFSHRLLI